jgi:hypothetical protein
MQRSKSLSSYIFYVIEKVKWDKGQTVDNNLETCKTIVTY